MSGHEACCGIGFTWATRLLNKRGRCLLPGPVVEFLTILRSEIREKHDAWT